MEVKPNLNIYILSGNKSPKASNCKVGYVIEYMTEKGPCTASDIRHMTLTTANRSTLATIAVVLGRLIRPCNITFYLDNNFIAYSLANGWLGKWVKNGWRGAKGEEIKNRDLWEKIDGLLVGHDYDVMLRKHHEYKQWLVRETAGKD